MKYFIAILSPAAAVIFSSLVMASESPTWQDFAGAPIVAHAPQQTSIAKMAMGPTSAAQKPGGTGQESQQTPKIQKRMRHNYTAS